MFNKRHSKDKNQSLLNTIRDKYELYINFYQKNPELRNQFEQRFIEAEYSGRDMERFLQEEDFTIQSLLSKEEAFLENDPDPDEDLFTPREPSFAEKLIDEFNAKMGQYPEAFYHKDAIPDVTRLYGAIKIFDQDHWPAIYPILSREFPQWKGTRLSKMERQLWEMTATKGKMVPLRLEKYYWMLESSNVDNADINRETRNCILEAALLLHDMKKTLIALEEKDVSDPAVDEGLNFITNVIEDFRLKDIKREEI